MRGILKHHEPLADYTSWHIGGAADIYYRPADMADLAAFLAELSVEIPVTFLGLGSNVLISDEGVRGAVIHTLSSQADSLLSHENLKILSSAEKEKLGFKENKDNEENSEIIRIEAGVTSAKLAKFCAKNGLVGAEFFAGIPGTLGGALAMNAGAWGGETWNHVTGVEVINRQGVSAFRNPTNYTIGYRSVKRQGVKAEPEMEWFSAGFLQFKKGDPLLATERIKALLKERNEKQPIGVFSCGSVFKNPLPQHAGQLIEASKLKGFAIGDAEVSPKHANFILNRGKATAKDVLALITHIQKVVLADHGIALETEVKIMGFDKALF